MSFYMRLFLGFTIIGLLLKLTVSSPVSAEDPSPTPAVKPTQAAVLDLTDLKIQMSEGSLKVNPTLRSLAELSSALETYLTKNCFGDLLKTLTYQGPPTNPDCIARMERLFEIYPENPVAVCLRDGLEAQTCRDAYRNQSLKKFSGGGDLKSIPDPALKVGLSAADNSKIKALSETLMNVNRGYQQATTDEEKQKHLNDATSLYDQLLSISCKIVALELEEPEDSSNKPKEDSSITQAREKLLKIPPALRSDYQRQMLLDAERELAQASKDKERQKIIIERIKVINNPDTEAKLSAAGKLRNRVVLPTCYDYIEQTSKLIPNFPSPICHRDGWYSPQCIDGIKQWHTYKKQMAETIAKRSGKKVAATPNAIISSF
jgi:hypothetical protein